MSTTPPSLRDDDSVSSACYARYTSDVAVGQYCDAHYGPDRLGLPNFGAELVRLCLAAHGDRPQRRALDLGCAVGRASFELARSFEQVTAIDYASRLITLAQRLQRRGHLRYQLIEEGDLLCEHIASLAECGLVEAAPRVSFHQGDAQQLGSRYRNYDLVLAAHLIDRLPAPARFLRQIHERLVIGGLLVLTSPYNWLEEYTPRRKWLGGCYKGGKPQVSLSTISRLLRLRFEMVEDPIDMPFAIRETARKYQYNIAQLSFWRRVD